MSKFNLIFRGEIVEGHDPDEVRLRLAELLGTEDDSVLQRCFSGDPVVLRRDLERKEAAELYAKLRRKGIRVDLVKIGERGDLHAGESVGHRPHSDAGTESKSVNIGSTKTTKTTPNASEQSDSLAEKSVKANSANPAGRATHGASKARARSVATTKLSAQTNKNPDVSGQVLHQVALQQKENALASALLEKEKEGQHQPSPGTEPRSQRRKPATTTANRSTRTAQPKAAGKTRQKSTSRTTRSKRKEQTAKKERDAESQLELQLEKEEAQKRLAVVQEQQLRQEQTQKEQLAAKQARLRAQLAEEARIEAERAEHARLEAQRAEKARIEAERAEQARLEAERAEKARIEAERAEQARLEAERAEKARIEAERAEQARLEAERAEQARIEAERAEQARLEAERAEKARIEAERAEQARLEAERAEKARIEAERAEQARLEAERAEKARIEAERAEQARLEAERAEKARIKAERAEQARLEAEQAAKSRRERERLAQEKARQKEREKRRAEEEADRARVEAARKKRQQAEANARRKAEEQRRKLEQRNRAQAEAEEQSIQRAAMENMAIQRAASELAQNPSIKRVEKRAKSSLGAPSPPLTSSSSALKSKRKRQPGAANIYSLSPFRNTPEIRDRAGLALVRMRRAYQIGFLSLILACLLLARVLTLTPETVPSGPSAIAIAPPERLLLLAGDRLLLHDRAGVNILEQSLGTLGLSTLQTPMAFDANGRLLAVGSLLGAQDQSPILVRCDIEQSGCTAFAADLQGTNIAAMVVNPIDDSLLIADAVTSELIKLDSAGNIVARGEIPMTVSPVMRLDSGLLLTNSAAVPGISVFRYEESAFGEQLDEVILMPSPGSLIEFTELIDFSRNGDFWWALIRTNTGLAPRLYRFDEQWQLVDAPPLTPGTQAQTLATWGSRTLVSDPDQLAIQRFSRGGSVEAPLESESVAALVNQIDRRKTLEQLGWRIGLAVSVLVCIAAFALGAINRARSMVYTSCKEQGAAPVDEIADEIDWVAIDPERKGSLIRTGVAYIVLSVGLILGAIGVGASVVQLSALLLALVGPACALLVMQRSDPGHLGTVSKKLVLVDHSGMYHFGGGSRVHYRGPFLIIDDVTVFTGTALMPGFVKEALQKQIAPIAHAGVKVDRKIITVKLLQGRHPLAIGAVIVFACSIGAVALLSLHGIF